MPAKDVLVTIERYSRQAHSIQPASTLDLAAVVGLLSAIRDEWSTTVEFATEKHRLLVSASEGKFAVFAMVGDDDFYDLVGDQNASGRTEFAHGGQSATWPKRHCVSLELAQRVVEEFLRAGEIDIRAFDWERQGGLQLA